MPTLEGLIWKRSDFRESSRLVTLLTREQGKVTCLAKGAHRPESPLLGRLDFLNRCEVTLAGRGMPILARVRLLHEPRGLRRPRRFLIANYLVEIFDRPLLEARPEPQLYDLVQGALTLCELAPIDSLPVVLAGIELRYLDNLGALPAPLTACSQCGTPDRAPGSLGLYVADASGGVFCARHRPRAARRAPPGALEWLAELEQTPGKEWPKARPPAIVPAAQRILGGWIAAALELRPHGRELALHGA